MGLSARSSPETRAPEILKRLRKAYPGAGCELRFRSPLELLVATILSAQCTDARVNEVTRALFRTYRTPKAYAQAKTADIETMIRPTGFYRNKARSIQNCCAQIMKEFGGKVPEAMEDLTKLSGVGRKTANLVRAFVFGKPAVICDTHVIRVSGRLGLTRHEEADRIEADLAKLLPEKRWTDFSTLLMWHGRRCCTARKPSCSVCPLRDICPYAASL